MLGDHFHWRKTYPYEGSARVPLLIRYPASFTDEYENERYIDRPVGLEDIMPTILDVTGTDCPPTVDGRNLLDLAISPDRQDWRQLYHGEHGPTYHEATACQYLVGDFKYVWNPLTGDELFFDLESDPNELTNLVQNPDYHAQLERHRDALTDRLAGRPEGFSDGESLSTVPTDTWS
jgi:arylsulfatase A-like enzyme